MEYTVNQLAQMSGVSTRTLRYYDEIGLLAPAKVRSNGYRIYGQAQVDLLQQILFFRELDMSLEHIKDIITSSAFDSEKTLQHHLSALEQRKARLEILIENVTKTMASLKGETIMSDKEKFEGFKQKLIEENQQKYGKEVREKYGDEAVEASNAKMAGMTQQQWQEQETLSKEIGELLKAGMQTGNPAGEEAQKACDLHRKWLCMFWKDGMYSKQAHRSLGEMYVADERFKAHYDSIAAGAAEFFNEALKIYCKE